MFEITEGDVLLAHLNTRTEKHGDEDVGAIDLKIKCRAANTILDLFDPRLRSTLFQRAGGGHWYRPRAGQRHARPGENP